MYLRDVWVLERVANGRVGTTMVGIVKMAGGVEQGSEMPGVACKVL